MLRNLITHNPALFAFETLSTIVIVALCFILFYKLKEFQELSGKTSLKLFRYSFLFFGLAYIFRLSLTLIAISMNFLETDIRAFLPIFLPLIAFTSFIAIANLTVSMIKNKKILEHKYLHQIISGVAITVLMITMISRSMKLLFAIEVIMVLGSLTIMLINHRKSKRKYLTTKNTIYILLFFFWLLSMSMMLPLFGRELMRYMFIPMIFSTGIFIFIYRKIMKWVQ